MKTFKIIVLDIFESALWMWYRVETFSLRNLRNTLILELMLEKVGWQVEWQQIKTVWEKFRKK